MFSAVILLNSRVTRLLFGEQLERLPEVHIYSLAELANTRTCCYCLLCVVLCWAGGVALVSYV